MKKIFKNKIAFAFILIVFISSCKKALELNPVDTVKQENALLTSKDVQAALVGAYSDLGRNNFFGGRVFLMADFLANTDAIIWNGTFEELTQATKKSLLKTNTFVDDVWSVGYRSINDANNVLAALDKVEASSKNQVEGEAKFIRGASYFELVRMFGKDYNDGNATANLGIPIVTTPTVLVSEANNLKRATVADVYNQAITDLKDAEAKLPEENGFFASKYTAAAMLARIYLQMGNYAEAAAAADRVITSGKYQLTATFLAAFPKMPEGGKPAKPADNTTEDIFAMQVTTLTGANGFNEFYGSSTFGGRGDAVISQDWIDATYSVGDDRANAFYDDDDIFTAKFGNQFGNVPVIRLAEMYLIRAESNARLSSAAPIGGKTPLEDLSVIRSRAGLTTTSATVDDIINERKLEFAFEGFSLHDAKRTKTNIGNIPWNSTRLIFPIPQREMDANKNLIQNPGY